jgi:Tfp pilus assembly protein PilF
LVAFWPADATERDYALAYADQSWQHQNASSIKQAHEKLLQAWSHSPGDPAVAAQLAYTWDFLGDHDTAETLYRQALKADPENLIALTNLGTLLAQHGEINQANGLWRKALSIDPGLAIPGLNLTRGEKMEGQGSAALAIIRRVLSLHPDSEAALKLERDLARKRRYSAHEVSVSQTLTYANFAGSMSRCISSKINLAMFSAEGFTASKGFRLLMS